MAKNVVLTEEKLKEMAEMSSVALKEMLRIDTEQYREKALKLLAEANQMAGFEILKAVLREDQKFDFTYFTRDGVEKTFEEVSWRHVCARVEAADIPGYLEREANNQL